jgi:hypothetical protein
MSHSVFKVCAIVHEPVSANLSLRKLVGDMDRRVGRAATERRQGGGHDRRQSRRAGPLRSVAASRIRAGTPRGLVVGGESLELPTFWV